MRGNIAGGMVEGDVNTQETEAADFGEGMKKCKYFVRGREMLIWR